ncbi:MAG TPA: cell wall-binding repeat-containing protein, partial [Acidothermaceae bacterium]|nr:cell wall-binding repeat-containing protein [Acidothermaceae bacterium]
MRVVGAVAATLAALASVTIGLPTAAGSVLAAEQPSGAAAPAAAPAPTPSPTTGQGTLTRVAGADRIATSVRISEIGFPNKLSATAVVLARADDFADELAGGPLAARFQGPLLLTPSAGLTDAVRLEIQRVLAVGHTVYLLGGTDAISANVGTNLQALGYNPVRVDGTDRYDTAVKIANILGDPPTVFEVDGTNFPDGLSAGPAAALSHGVILLTAGHVQAPETAQYLGTHPTDVRYAIGGPAAAADPTAQPLVGADRYATSILVANQLFASPSIVAIASGVAFPDALSGG